MTPVPTPSPLDLVEFLARSSHRVEVLRTLATGPWTRPDLHEETGISQPTLGRVLGSLEERHWVEKRGREYALTALGDLLVAEFEDLLDTVATVQRLGDVIGLLPTEEMDFDLRLLGSAAITTPQPGDVMAHIRRAETIVYEAQDLRILSDAIPPGTVDEHNNRIDDIQEADRRVEGVVAGDTLDQTFDLPGLAGWDEVLATDQVTIYRYDGSIPLMLGIADGTAFLFPKDDHGMPAAFIETDDETILAWVEAQYEAYKEQATELTPENLPP